MKFLTDLIQNIKDMFNKGQAAIESAKYKAELLKSVASAMSDGQLTREEVMDIVRLKDRLGISDEDLAKIGGEKFVQMFNQVRDALESVNTLTNDAASLSSKINEVQKLVSNKVETADSTDTTLHNLKAKIRRTIVFATTDDELSPEEILEITRLQQEAGISQEELFEIGGQNFADMFLKLQTADKAMESVGISI